MLQNCNKIPIIGVPDFSDIAPDGNCFPSGTILLKKKVANRRIYS